MNIFREARERNRKGSPNEHPRLIRYFGFIRDVIEDNNDTIPLVLIEIEGRPGRYIAGGKYIPLAYPFSEYSIVFGDQNIKGAYVEVITDEAFQSVTARIIALKSEIEAAKEHGGRGDTALQVLARGNKVKRITDEGTPSTKPYLY